MEILPEKHEKVNQTPMLADEGFSNRSVEMSALEAGPDFSLKISDDQHITQLFGNTRASIGVKGVGRSEDGSEDLRKHEHLLRSGSMGKCNDPFCTTCPSYFERDFEYSKQRYRFGSAEWMRRIIVRLRRATLSGSRAGTWGRSCMHGILNPHTKRVNQWNKIFCISLLIAVFIDPLFFFLLSVSATNFCLLFNNTAAVAVTVVRSFTDAIHAFHILLQFRVAYIRPDSKVRGAGELEDNPKKIAVHYAKTWFLLDLFTALPLPQVLIWTVVKAGLVRDEGANYAKDLMWVVLAQNITRSIRFFPFLIGRTPSGFVFETAWVNFVINLLMYLLAGHIVGSCWYLFGLQRINTCLQRFCETESNGTFQCQNRFLDCGGDGEGLRSLFNNSTYKTWRNNTAVGTNCLPPFGTNPPNFPYGIYLLGLPVFTNSSTIEKYIYSLFWGFQQISTLAGNQQPSTFLWEVLFTFGIVVLGLLLFAVLIGNIQNFLQAFQRRKLDVLKMQLKSNETESWMRQRRLPQSLRKRVQEAVQFKWVATGGVDEQDLMSEFPEDLQKDIQRYLCLELVKKVRLFELLEDHVLDAICENLHQKLYIKNSYIMRYNKPVKRMLFIVRGKLESRLEYGFQVTLKKGDVCGDELLSWYIDRTGISDSRKPMNKHQTSQHPLCRRTVKCLTSVEAFSLESKALEYITTHYKAAFRSPKLQRAVRHLSLFWRTMAATRIQKEWRASEDRRARRESASNSTEV